MLRKRTILFIPILIVIVAGVLFLRPAPKSPPASVSPDDPSAIDQVRASEIAAIMEKYPMLDKANREERLKQPVSSWEEWVRARTDVSVGGMFSGYYEPAPFTPEEYSKEYERLYAEWTEIAEGYQREGYPVPTDGTHSSILEYTPRRNMYEGPQTVEAIMAALDDKYKNTFPRAAEMEETYPRDRFLQRVLDKGAVIKEYSDYEYWMKQRDMLLYSKDRPQDWQSGGYDIPVTTDFAEYEEGFLERKIWENNIINQVSEANPGRNVYVYFPASHPDVYLPSIGKMTYVYRSGSRTETMGTMLTKEQRDNLVHNGIEPEGIEIVYIDEDYNVLSEAPPPWSKFDVDPESHRVLFNGIPLTPDNYESVVGHPIPAEWLEDMGTQHNDAPIPPHDPYAARREFARAVAEREAARSREVAKMEFERFQNDMRQRKEFETMADKEISRELAKQFSQQFLSKHSLKQGTSKQLENAFQLMFQHGFEEGFRRVRQDSPSIADQLERYLAETERPSAPQKKPQRSTPPKPPESGPPETEAP